MSKYTHPEYYGSGFDTRHRDAFVMRMAVHMMRDRSVKSLRAELSIINESTAIDCGENVGGSTASPAAPEVAAEEDDGDGDGDPDPERQTKRRTARPLPPAQLSRPKAACALLGIGRTKLWQLSEQDPRFPRKIVLGPRCVGWRTDALIGYLRTLEQEA